MRPAARTRLTLVRHAASAANGHGATPTMSGRTDVGLCAEGRRQLAQLAARVATLPRFAAIYSSPLVRAADTARVLGGLVQFCTGLKEIDCGEVDGLPVDDVRARHPAAWAQNLAQRDDDFRWPGGESYRELRRRCLEAVTRIAAAHPGAEVAVVTHAGVINQIIGAIHGAPAAAWEPWRPGNTSLTVVEWHGDTGVLISFDDRGHLTGDR